MRAVNVSYDPLVFAFVRLVPPKVAVVLLKYPVMMLQPFARAETPRATSLQTTTPGGPGVGAISINLRREGVV